MEQAKVTRIVDEPVITRAGNVASVKRVEFIVGNHGPFYARIPSDQFTDAKVREEMQKVADTINALPQAG